MIIPSELNSEIKSWMWKPVLYKHTLVAQVTGVIIRLEGYTRQYGGLSTVQVTILTLDSKGYPTEFNVHSGSIIEKYKIMKVDYHHWMKNVFKWGSKE